jgi:hypothetical protein
LETIAVPTPVLQREVAASEDVMAGRGALIINADDWGRDSETTDRILECVLHGAVSSASAMVFMEDSERAAAIAIENGVDVGLHLNFTTPFSGSKYPARVADHQQRLGAFLLGGRLAQAVFHPGLANSFHYVVTAQIEEFQRLHGRQPGRIDGHHHMHLCANVLFAGLLPPGTIARRNFSFLPGEKSGINRRYRTLSDWVLARQHRLTDLFYSLPPLEPPQRLDRIFRAAKQSFVEVETHPVNAEEYRFLREGGLERWVDMSTISRNFALPERSAKRRAAAS